METAGLSYREVLPDFSQQDNWIEVTLNTGGTQSTLQDIKVAEKAGGYCFQNVELNHNRNRYIYWRTYQDILELTEISLDFNLYQNSVRYKFTDSPVISVTIYEQQRLVTLLVTTVCSLHRINFPHPDVLADCGSTGSSSASGSLSGASSAGISVEFNDSQSFSIFREANANNARNPTNFYVIDTQSGASTHSMPHAANSFLSPDGDEAYFALASQTQLTLYVMDCETGHTVVQPLKEHYTMPRLFSNIKGALIGRSENTDAEYATSLVFSFVAGHIYLMALYRNDHLRVWSTQTLQIACSINCVREGFEQRMQGPQSNALRKILNRSMCVFLSHAMGAEFVVIDIHVEELSSGGYKLSLVRRKVIAAPQLDLADFEVCNSHIWALWSNAEGEFSISSFPFKRSSSRNWMSAAMEPPPDRYSISIEQGMDSREAYCSYIFHPGKFERSVIAKALFMFRRSNVRLDKTNTHCNMTLLKEHVCQAVDEEIKHEIKEYEVSDEEYMEIAARQWERFYSCCEQYHMKACQPIGLVILAPIDAVCVVKKSTSSLLRPCETLEHFMLAGSNVDKSSVLPLCFEDNEEIGEQLIDLVAILAQIEQWLPEDTKIELDKRFYQLEMPALVISRLTDEILGGSADREIFPSDFQFVLQQKLRNISNLCAATSMLMDFLRQPEAAVQTHSNLNQSTRFLMCIGTLFGSHAGLSLLSETVRQIASIRFAICRNLLIMQQLLIDSSATAIDLAETLRTQFMPDIYVFLQSYYVIVWISETSVNINTASALETSMQRLHLLQLTNGSGRIFTNGGKCHFMSLLRVFLNAKGLFATLASYADQYKLIDQVTWQNTLLPISAIVSQLIWPISANFLFGEWLFSTCQHILIEEYVRLLKNWCEWNICSRQFILGITLLDCGESHKAYDMFLQAARGVVKEPFLKQKIIKDPELAQRIENLNEQNINLHYESTHTKTYNQAIAQFYLKVIQLFEQHHALDHIIDMAEVAIALLPKDDPQLPMFQSIVFNNHLQLEHYEEAYHSLIYNSELSRRKDCLRQLVITLFNRKRLDLLMHFPYVGLHEEFENIVESRARSQLIEQNEIYEFLYAFHVNNGNMRKASAVTYEQAMRLQLESETLDGMQKRCNALLVCINALHLIDPRYRWIAKPVIGDENTSKRRMSLGSDDAEIPQAQQVEVLEIKDIRRELLHTQALVHLAQHRKDIQSFLHADAEELTMILASCGLFTAALKLAKGYQISLLPLFDSLTAACVRTSDESANEAWAWLQENDLADLPHRNKPADMAWSLLQKLVLENEIENDTQIRKSVVNKLLSLNAFVPQWLMNDYKLANCSELLRLFVRHNRLLEAADLGIEMLKAMLGLGSEYFSFKHAIAVTNPLMCLPLNTLDLLLHGLKLNSKEDIEYEEAYLNLEEMLLRYINTATHIAEDKIQLAMQQKQAQQQIV